VYRSTYNAEKFAASTLLACSAIKALAMHITTSPVLYFRTQNRLLTQSSPHVSNQTTGISSWSHKCCHHHYIFCFEKHLSDSLNSRIAIYFTIVKRQPPGFHDESTHESTVCGRNPGRIEPAWRGRIGGTVHRTHPTRSSSSQNSGKQGVAPQGNANNNNGQLEKRRRNGKGTIPK
jgi:hypothetical protein